MSEAQAILVTGGNGFLGTAICRQLRAKGYPVRAYQRSAAPQLAALGVEVCRGDLADGAALGGAVRGCRAVIHTAALAGVWGPRQQYFAVNLDGTRAVMAAVAAQGVQCLVHCSTPSVVFSGEAFEGADAGLPYGRNWLCHYAESKALAEAAVLEGAANGQFKAVALRPHLIFGVGDPHLLPTVIDRARSGRLRIVGDGRNRVDVTAVDNAARAHIQAMEWLLAGGAGGGAYFLSQGQPVVLWDWINDILARVGVKPLRRRVPYKVAYGVGAACELAWRLLGKHSVPPMTRFVAAELAKSHWFNIDAAREDFGYEPERIATTAAVADYVAAYRAGQTPTRPKH